MGIQSPLEKRKKKNTNCWLFLSLSRRRRGRKGSREAERAKGIEGD